MNDNLINKFITDEKFHKLASSFKLHPQKYNYRNIIPPFDQLYKSHISYIKTKDFSSSLNVLKTSCLLLDCPNKNKTRVLFKFIIQNCINQIDNKINCEEETRSLIKIILEIYKDTKYHVLCNILFRLYFKIDNYELAYNFLLVTTNTRKGKKDFYIYNLYKSLLYLYKGDIEEANECINIAYMSKNIRTVNDSNVLFFIINLINNKAVKTQDPFLIKLRDVVKLGLYSKIFALLDNVMFRRLNIFEIVRTYLPLVCFTNLIKRIFYLKSEDYKLNLDFLLEVLDMEYEEMISLVCSVIEINLVKGYISINKNMMVFSRKDPFPESFNK
ncbi:PCI domain-containing protein 2 [Vairimorpha necatrix]|uniref:PCI domain-containing protein 2 n=1 Tax=Vairimorpha necatrix TaxID=6039 RepID=A0AAX4JD52_9MICR